MRGGEESMKAKTLGRERPTNVGDIDVQKELQDHHPKGPPPVKATRVVDIIEPQIVLDGPGNEGTGGPPVAEVSS